MHYGSVLSKYPIFTVIQQVADLHHVEAYVVGGFVRDLLLERPCKDIDVVCIGNGVELARAVAKALGKDVQVIVFKNFGTAMLRWEDWEVEFVGARKESYERGSRKPAVTS